MSPQWRGPAVPTIRTAPTITFTPRIAALIPPNTVPAVLVPAKVLIAPHMRGLDDAEVTSCDLRPIRQSEWACLRLTYQSHTGNERAGECYAELAHCNLLPFAARTEPHIMQPLVSSKSAFCFWASATT